MQTYRYIYIWEFIKVSFDSILPSRNDWHQRISFEQLSETERKLKTGSRGCDLLICMAKLKLFSSSPRDGFINFLWSGEFKGRSTASKKNAQHSCWPKSVCQHSNIIFQKASVWVFCKSLPSSWARLCQVRIPVWMTFCRLHASYSHKIFRFVATKKKSLKKVGKKWSFISANSDRPMRDTDWSGKIMSTSQRHKWPECKNEFCLLTWRMTDVPCFTAARLRTKARQGDSVCSLPRTKNHSWEVMQNGPDNTSSSL